jgi:hypothetical protein
LERVPDEAPADPMPADGQGDLDDVAELADLGKIRA